MIVSHDGKGPNTFNKDLTSYVRDLWMKAMEAKMESL